MIEFSISEIAAELGQARATVSKRLAAGNAEPSGERKGAPVYPLSEVIRCLGAAATGKRDPGRMTPFEARAHFQAEREKLRLGVEAGDLMPRADVAAVLGRIAGPLVRELDTLPDRLERDMRVSGDVVEYVRAVIRSTRDAMASAITEVTNR